MDDVTWFTLPLVDEPFTSVTHVGNGKDADLVIEFASGKRMKLAVSSTRVEADGGIIVEASAHGDTMLKITYTGSGLSLRRGRIGFPADDERSRAEFLDDASAWVGSDGDELCYVTDIELQLGLASQMSSATC